MNVDRKPINKKGERNALCPHYSNCLDDAVAKCWEFWDCCDCEFKQCRDPSIGFQRAANDCMPYYDLPVEIYEKVC